MLGLIQQMASHVVKLKLISLERKDPLIPYLHTSHTTAESWLPMSFGFFSTQLELNFVVRGTCHIPLQDHLVQPSLDTPDISPHSSPHSSRTPSQATQASPMLPALRSSAPQGADLSSPVRSSLEGWSAVGSRLSSVSMPAQKNVQATVVSEPQSPGTDFKDPISAKWPPQHFEGPAV